MPTLPFTARLRPMHLPHPLRLLPCSALILLLLPGCAGGPTQDPYGGYYIGREKTMKITPSGSGQYQVVIKSRDGKKISMEATANEGKLTSEYGGGYAIAPDTGDTFLMGGPGQQERIGKTDSVHFVQWWRAAGDTLIGTPEENPFVEP